jgi:hypothetical protein
VVLATPKGQKKKRKKKKKEEAKWGDQTTSNFMGITETIPTGIGRGSTTPKQAIEGGRAIPRLLEMVSAAPI